MTMQTETPEPGLSARADFVIALVLAALGLYVFIAAYTMPRLEARNIDPSTIPGLVPMILGAALAILGGFLALRSWRLREPGGWGVLLTIFTTKVAARVFTAAALILIFTLGLIGWLPFWAASMIFIFAFVLTFEVVLADEPDSLLKSIMWALATAIILGGGIYYLFAEVFLVRLP